MVTTLLTAANFQAETGGSGGMKLDTTAEKKDTSGHHRLHGSSLHENAENYHKVAAKHHKNSCS